MSLTILIPLVVFAALILINGIFVASEFAAVAARQSRLETRADSGNRSARWIVSLFAQPMGKDRYIAIAQLGVTLASIGLGMYGEPTIADWLHGPFERWGLSAAAAHTVAFIVALSAVTYMHVVFGEMIPKALALQDPERMIEKVNPAMRAFGLAFRPMVWAVNMAALGLMRALRIPEPDHQLSLYTSTELAIITDEAADSGQLGAIQRNLIKNIFDLDETTAEELMTSRSRVETLAIDATESEVVARISDSPISRYPVVDGDLDQVIGVLHIKDFIRAQQQGLPLDLAALARPVTSVAANANAEQLLEQFKRNRMHASLVVDEYGSTLGFVTLDDVIAEVMDDHVSEQDSDVVRHPDGSFTVDGETTLTELREEFGLDYEHAEVTTIAGLILAEIGSVPGVGETVLVNADQLVVEEVEGRKITRVSVRRFDTTMASPPPEEELRHGVTLES